MSAHSDTSVQVKHRPLSFCSAQEMRARIEHLPSPPRWKEVEVGVEGGTTKDPLTLYYRDGLECFEFLFGNPLFLDHMEYIPRHEFTTGESSERLYNEMMTGDRAWDLQVSSISNAFHSARLMIYSMDTRNGSKSGKWWAW